LRFPLRLPVDRRSAHLYSSFPGSRRSASPCDRGFPFRFWAILSASPLSGLRLRRKLSEHLRTDSLLHESIITLNKLSLSIRKPIPFFTGLQLRQTLWASANRFFFQDLSNTLCQSSFGFTSYTWASANQFPSSRIHDYAKEAFSEYLRTNSHFLTGLRLRRISFLNICEPIPFFFFTNRIF